MSKITGSTKTKKSARQKTSKSDIAKKKTKQTQISAYHHEEKRINNPDVGMVLPETDPDGARTNWKYDPHLDPVLNFDISRSAIEDLIDQAIASDDHTHMKETLKELKRYQKNYLNWTGKAEKTSFDIDTVSLHVHERIDPATILANASTKLKQQANLFASPFENMPLHKALEFYSHEKGWSNRMISGDSLLVMNSLITKESMAGKVQMIFFDPPYGIKYGSNFQPFTNKREVKDRKSDDLTQEPETIKAFRDTWELGIHSYLTYLRDRFKLAHDLLSETGSIFVQISDENVHHVRELLDEIFGPENFFAQINIKVSGPLGKKGISKVYDYIIWYAKNCKVMKFNKLFKERNLIEDKVSRYEDLGGVF